VVEFFHAALQQLTKEKTMFDFTKQTKQFEELAKRIQEVNEFWYTIVKDFFNTAKTK
jgi:nitrate reductase assembly molybdenum cofactor insertion protein NarJ